MYEANRRFGKRYLNKYYTCVMLFSALLIISYHSATQAQSLCRNLFKEENFKFQHVKNIEYSHDAIELLNYVSKSISRTEEFDAIRKESKKLGIRAWLFGGTASTFLHYTRASLDLQKGKINLNKDHFDFDFTNIFRSNQDLDIVVDGTPEQIEKFEKFLSNKFPYFLGTKTAWEVRTLRTSIGKPGDINYKEGLLDDPSFSNQNTDSNSLGMIEISESNEPVIRDLSAWNKGKNQFLEDAVRNSISYLKNAKHSTTPRYKMGQNPEILSVVRLLVKAFQFNLEINPNSISIIKKIIEDFDPSLITNSTALRRLNETAVKLVLNSVNIERTMKFLNDLGLLQKLISMNLTGEDNSASFWLSKEPLRSFEIPEDGRITELPKYNSGLLTKLVLKPTGKTAKDLGILVVAHEARSILGFDNISRSVSEPNVIISRGGVEGENANYGDGFYTMKGRVGADFNTGLTIRFNVNPSAREGVDFVIYGNIVIFLNKKALNVIQESVKLGIIELVDAIENGKFNFDKSDRGLLEKTKRRLKVGRITKELEELVYSEKIEDLNKLECTLASLNSNPKIKDLVAEETFSQVVIYFYDLIAKFKNSNNEAQILKYIRLVSPILSALNRNNVISKDEFKEYLLQKSKEISSPEGISLITIELTILDGPEQFLKNFQIPKSHPNLIKNILNKIKFFSKSNDRKKMKVISIISDEKELALKEDNIQRLERLIDLGLLDVNTLSFSGHSLLLEAGYYEAKKIIDFIVSSKDLDLKSTNVNGHNVIEELRFFGKVEIANYIEKKLGKIKFKKIDFKERHISKTSIYPNGSPIVDWVRIKPGSFKMGNQQKIPVKLTKAFNLMSVDTTQRMWKGIVELIKLNSLPQAEFLNEDPSHFKGLDKPVESISQSDVNHWLNGLNLLSNIESGEIQKKLLELFPGHYLGKNYRLPTAAEWEYVTRIEGLATSDYVFGATYLNINEYAWFSKNSNGETHPVGQKKPILINGKPVYDIQGNVSKRVQDLWDGKNILLGGIDPVGTRGTFNMTIGGAWYHVEQGLILGRFSPTRGDIRSNQIGIRLVSDVP